MEELELLNKIKEQLMDQGSLRVQKGTNPQVYSLDIYATNWHEIFKTDEYNKRKKS